MTKLWGGRFDKGTDKLVEAFNASIVFDQRMYREDIRGSIAHARMLAKCSIIQEADAQQIVVGLTEILADIEQGKFDFSLELEDIHMNIEKRLTDKIGIAGARLHTARSRNDQVALDLHMYVKKEVAEIAGLIVDLQSALLSLADKHKETIMPGYTHLQRAQPVTFGHHLLAYFQMLARDFRRLSGVWAGADIMPLGAGALAGTTFPIDRHYVAEQLNFSAVYGNSMDAVSDRDYVLEFMSFSSVLMMHLSRLSEEIILWSSSEFAFIELDDAYATGSSMMPQKKNPDVAELVRGKTGRVYGNLLALLTVIKGLPLTYNKDLQEDKEGLFDTIDTVKFSLLVYKGMLETLRVNEAVMQQVVFNDFSNATDLADYLVKKGLPFRQSHEIVNLAIREKITLSEIKLETYRSFSDLFESDLLELIKPKVCVENRRCYGGPSPEQTAVQLDLGEQLLKEQRNIVAEYCRKI